MAFDHTPLPFGPHAPRAGADLTGYQYRGVLLARNDTVVPIGAADAGSLAGSPVFLLVNAPNSGDACTLNAIGNTGKALAMGTTFIGGYVAVVSGGGFTASSYGDLNVVGNAFEAVTSGQLFSLALRR